MASEAAVSSAAPVGEPPADLMVLYDVNRKRKPIFKADGKIIDVDASYADIFALPAGEGVVQPCKICAVADAFRGETPKSLSTANTSAKTMHLACSHPSELLEAHTLLGYVKDKLHGKKPSGAASASGAIVGSMDSYVRKGRVPPDFDFNTEWALMTITDARPFAMIEGEGLARFWERADLNSHFDLKRLPSADTITRRAVLIDEALQLHLSTHLFPTELGHTVHDSADAHAAAAAGNAYTLYSVSVDGWTSASGIPVMGSTLHYITPTWDMRDLALSARACTPPHTADKYFDTFGAVLEEYGLSEDHILGLSTDSASNMINFSGAMLAPHMRCINHAIHNAVIRSLKKVDDMMIAPSALGSFFSSIATTRNHIVSLKAEALGLPPPPKVVVAVDTRWNSRLAALRCHVARWDVVSQLRAKDLRIMEAAKATEYNALHDRCTTFHAVYRSVIALLEPIDEWTTRLQATKSPSLSLMFMCRDEILASLQEIEGEDDRVANIRTLLRNDLQAVFDEFCPVTAPKGSSVTVGPDMVRYKMHMAAAALDVRTVAHHLPRLIENLPLVLDYITHSYSWWQRPQARVESVNTGAQSAGAAGAAASKGPKSAISAALATLAERKTATSPQLITAHQVEAELTGFLTEEGARVAELDRDSALAQDPLAWWKANHAKYPILAHVARSLLAVPATSSSVERLFSSAGLVSSGLRGSVTADTLEMSALVRSAAKGGIDVRDVVGRLLKRNADAANAKRSATLIAYHQVKKRRGNGAGAGADASSSAIVVDGANSDEEGTGTVEAPAPDVEVDVMGRVEGLLRGVENGGKRATRWARS